MERKNENSSAAVRDKPAVCPHCLWERHLVHLKRARFGKNRIHHPHDHATDKNGPRHHGQALQILADLFFQQIRGNGGDDEGYQRQTQGMRKNRSISAFSSWKRRKEPRDGCPEIDRQRQDRSELNHDGVHLPKAVVQIDLEQRFGDPQMGRRADRQELGQAFNNA
jgi:hypothetical protein